MATPTAGALLALIAITACSNGPVTAAPSPSPSPVTVSTTAPPWPAAPATAPCAASLPAGSPPLMVVYEQAGGGPFSKVVIAGLDATGRARAVFDNPGVGLFTEPPPHLAYVVKGSVYFIDGYGTVFSLSADGKRTVVTTFPIQKGQQAQSFAVSPDGCQFATSILDPGLEATGKPWILRTMKATAGGPAELLHTWTSPNLPNSKSPDAFKNLVLVGWDSLGPIAVAGSSLEYASPLDNVLNFVANPDFLGGQVVHLAGDGTAGAAAAPSTCNAAKVSPGGDIACFQASSSDTWTLSVVRSVGGSVAVSVRIPVGLAHSPAGGLPCRFDSIFGGTAGPCPGAYVALGPNGLVAATWAVSDSTGVPAKTKGLWQGPDGSGGSLPAFFHPEGWIDAHTIFGQHTTGLYDASLVRTGDPTLSVEDLQFTGNFVGMLSA